MGILLGLRTSALNPTVWLLVMMAASAVVASVRRESARLAFTRALGMATRTPVLLALGVAVLGGLGSRVVVGYLVPGSYAEEVLAARSFVSARQLYRGGDREDFSKWLADEPAPITPWTLPGLTVCQASALESRPQFYTAHGHSPALLMASVPVVAVGGGRTLYVVLVLLSLLTLGGMAMALSAEAGMPPGSAAAMVLLLALAGWQPSLASIRQGDAVIIVAGLIVWSWRLLRGGDDLMGGVTAGLSGALFLPALVLMIPVGLRSRRALVFALATMVTVAGATVAVAGPMILSDYAASTVSSGRLYAASPMMYSAFGHLLALDPRSAAPVLWAGLVALALTTTAVVSARSGSSERPHSSAPDAERFDTTMAVFATVMFLIVPIAWSQHVTLLVLPIWALMGRVLSLNRPGRLAILAGLVLLLSLPDPAVVWMGVGLKLAVGAAVADALPSVPVWAAAGLWVWLLLATVSPCGSLEQSRNFPAGESVPR
jgi:Glycosyltransferase family 87